jgi:acetyltransferase
MTYIIHRYPVHLIDVVRVADGSPVTIRPTLPQDIELQRTFFRSLSAEARRLRFMTRLAELPAALVERFANADHASHVALLAEVYENGRERMIGEARYVVDGHDPAACEFAIAVADGWQRSGIARALFDRLEHQAARAGVRCMAADTLATNRPMIALAMRTGYAVTISRQDATLARLEKTLPMSAAAEASPLAA